MKKKALIITGRLAQDHEFIYPFYRLKEENYEVFTAIKEKKIVLGYFGTKIPPQQDDKIIGTDDILEKNFDLLILPGEVKAMEHIRLDKKVIECIKEFNNKNKTIGAICSATMLLISANIIKNRKVSGYYAWKDDISNAGGIFTDQPCVIDNNLVTSPHYKYNGQWMKGVIEVEKKK
jgi:protease I